MSDDELSRDNSRRGVRLILAHLRYRFDLALARGPLVIIGYLGVIMVVIIAFASLLLTALQLSGVNGGGELSFGEAFWQSLLRVLDPGTFSGDEHIATRLIGLFVTLSGVLLAGSLIGLIANGVDQQIEKLRKGRSAVLEQNHTLVLGWSPRLPAILSSLVIANANHKRRAVVVLADQPKDELEDELRRLVPDTQTTRVVCRTGDTGDVQDLRMVNVDGARAVIILAGEDGDAGVVKAVLALRTLDPTFGRLNVVAELNDPHHAATLRSLTAGRVATVRADEVITRITAQACHQAGLASVFRDLLDFDGDEIYFAKVPELVGHTYRDALRAFDKACVIGIFRAGTAQLNPPNDSIFAEGDEVIAIAEDDDAIVFTGFVPDDEHVPDTSADFEEPPQRIAVVGWSPLGGAVLTELDQFLSIGSVVDVLVDRTVFAAEEVTLPELTRCEVNVSAIAAGPIQLVDTVSQQHYDKAIVLGYRRGMNPAEADARSMLALLALQQAWVDEPHRPRLVAEMLDRSNIDIAQTTGADDFIVSDELSSLMIAALAERVELQDVFDELFDADGCFISLRPAGLFAANRPTTFGAIVSAVADSDATALGYLIGGSQVVLNPAKSTEVNLAGPDDRVLVLGERVERPTGSPPIDAATAAS